ncbi:MAG: LysR family transcriptional regulator [Clostridiales bacterium]|nr:LysR family transcriptional regulator [Clostridiales bacterium]
MVNLELYRVFYTVAKCGSLTRAAEELYISQPAVSRSIKQLETQLGVTLFTRTHRGMQLSAQGGQLIFEAVENALNLLSLAENRIAEQNASATGSIRIGASDTIFEYFLADKIVEFHEKFPAVKIDLQADVTPETIAKLKADKIDVAFVNLPVSPDPDLQLYGNCMRLNDVFVTSAKFAELTTGEHTLSKLKDYPIVLMDKNTVARRSLDNFLNSLGVEIQPSVEVGSWDLMKRFLVSGMGVGVIPREYIGALLEEESLFLIKTDTTLPARSVGMVLPKNATLSYALHCFVEEFRKGI